MGNVSENEAISTLFSESEAFGEDALEEPSGVLWCVVVVVVVDGPTSEAAATGANSIRGVGEDEIELLCIKKRENRFQVAVAEFD